MSSRAVIEKNDADQPRLDSEIVIVGAGISGIGMAIELKKRKIDNFILLEASDRLGGTWRDNTYPGVAVDIPSFSYSFSFEPNPNWSRLFAPPPPAVTAICAARTPISMHHARAACARSL